MSNTETTYWNGQEAPAIRGTVEVIDAPEFPMYWARSLVGQRIPVVMVRYGGHDFYLDDRDGSAWRKVTVGRGSPRFAHNDVAGKYFVIADARFTP